MQRVPTLVGVAGHFQGELYPLEYGKPMVIGRSRMVPVSLRRTEKYRLMNDEQREKDESAQTVSSKHFQITMFNLGSIEIKNLSPNGTRLDGKPIDAAIVTDVATKAHKIDFGADEAFTLEMRAKPEDA
jgi:hypothetical protein